MRRFYQESWQGIPFTTFAHTHFFHLADAKFYSVFYEELFRRYQSWDNLPATWRENKTRDALWLARRLKKMEAGKGRPVRVLSIGSGVGFMERMLIKEMGNSLELYVNEPSTVCMKWLRRLIPADRIFIGQPPDCLSPDIHYDMIYLSAVDYGIPQAQLVHTLDHLRYQLLPDGEIVCLSASLLEEETLAARFVNFCKNCIRGVLHYLGIRLQQFWGWRRTRTEYRQLFTNSGYKSIEDGFLDDGFDTYWIRGYVEERDTTERDPDDDAPISRAAVTAAAESANSDTDEEEPAGVSVFDGPATAPLNDEPAGPGPAESDSTGDGMQDAGHAEPAHGAAADTDGDATQSAAESGDAGRKPGTDKDDTDRDDTGRA